jgi:multimeric flavodoxin WrbA
MRVTLRCASAAQKRVAIVYGSFCRARTSHEDAKEFYEQIAETTQSKLRVFEPVAGNRFDFDSLRELDALVISTSSWFGYPPPEMRDFAHQLLLTAETNPGCLSHLQHAVWGNGDPKWFNTFMNMPRYMDLLLETAGSRRFFARGEYGEPHAPCGADECEPEEWAEEMWKALMTTEASEPPVPWDALWKYQQSPHHHEVVKWGLRELVKDHGGLDGEVTSLARPGAPYFDMLEEVAAENAAEHAAMKEKERAWREGRRR